MKLSLLQVGKTKEDYIREGVERYAARIRRVVSFEIVEVPERKTPSDSIEKRKDEEAQRLLERLPTGAYVVALDEHGRLLRSVEFAAFLSERQKEARPSLAFVIGGAYGHGRALLERADFRLSLSPLTFPHDLVRLLFVEQLYRAQSILRREPYHHE